jgi:hypothetical protein
VERDLQEVCIGFDRNHRQKREQQIFSPFFQTKGLSHPHFLVGWLQVCWRQYIEKQWLFMKDATKLCLLL